MGLDPKDGGLPMVQDLVESGIDEVPQRFVKPAEERSLSAAWPEDGEVPVIHAAELDTAEGIAKLDSACRDWGFFQLIGHGIPPELLKQVRKTVRDFFRLPQEQREAYAIRSDAPSLASQEGYGRFFVPSEETVLDWGDPVYHFLPPIRNWPSNPPEYRKVVEEYGQEIRPLAIKLLQCMAEALGQRASFFSEAFGPSPHYAIRLNYYPPCPQPELVIGLSPHSDVVGLTVLLQDEVEGLQVKKDGQWRSVRSIPDAFVVNVGDTVEILTNGAYKSVEHRAVVNKECSRISIATIYGPGRDRKLKPITSEEMPPLYKEVSMAELLEAFVNGELNGKGHLQFVRIA
ncbi:2-oxoglutarate-iron(II)-dependent oxygenase [Selaginella moellendorffii]|uniref:2-oxoglutarate-iron(II)-dependent oxygenase n=1 Tax=Selaginella moellendorffii TaxID=88036 RepID=D8SPT1_SELML|nr:protein SRG1 [Selaginella moellendorffii]EFJ13538.1 2-oxoglutarate-iron(II)-dependent oxygenase [Selaginella moellendorffii]|eukprot:XP_024515139.1 protein SRG1 [Selaginella moellendorffii]